MSLNVILSIISEENLKNLRFCKQLLRRAFQERNDSVIRSLLSKISTVFVFSDEEYRREIVEYTYNLTHPLSVEKILDLDKESIFGNVLIIYYLVKEISPLTSEKIQTFVRLSELKHIRDSMTLELVPTKDVIIIDLDERVGSINNPSDIEKCIEICELLFSNGLVARTIDTINGMLILYKNASKAELGFKGDIIASLIKKKLNIFLTLIKKVLEEVKHREDLIKYYDKIYDLLLRAGIPVFFDFEKIYVDFDSLYNGNFYFAKVLDKLGNIDLILPFDKVGANQIQKVYDLNTGNFVTPRGRIGKLLLHDIFSFRRVRQITQVPEQQISFARELRETEIERKIREILHDQNITTHSPVEKVDVYTLKLYVNNENDLRDAGMILKGRGYLKVNLDSVASNILKAIDLPVHIIFLIHTGVLDDVAREKFINQCNRAKKMYCVVDAEDLARLLIAYNKI